MNFMSYRIKTLLQQKINGINRNFSFSLEKKFITVYNTIDKLNRGI